MHVLTPGRSLIGDGALHARTFVIVTAVMSCCKGCDVTFLSLIDICRAGGHRLGCPVTTHSRFQPLVATRCRRQLAVSVRAQQAATLEKPAPAPTIAEGEDTSIWKATYDISNVRACRRMLLTSTSKLRMCVTVATAVASRMVVSRMVGSGGQLRRHLLTGVVRLCRRTRGSQRRGRRPSGSRSAAPRARSRTTSSSWCGCFHPTAAQPAHICCICIAWDRRRRRTLLAAPLLLNHPNGAVMLSCRASRCAHVVRSHFVRSLLPWADRPGPGLKSPGSRSWAGMLDSRRVPGAAQLASGEVFGHDQPLALHLLGSERSAGALEGVAMELEDSLYPLLREVSPPARNRLQGLI